MIPHVRERPLVLERYPEGVSARGLLQSDVAEDLPPWMGRAEVRGPGGLAVHPLVEHPEDLAWLANHDCTTIHRFLSRHPRLDQPDRLVFDLDPGGRWAVRRHLPNGPRGRGGSRPARAAGLPPPHRVPRHPRHGPAPPRRGPRRGPHVRRGSRRIRRGPGTGRAQRRHDKRRAGRSGVHRRLPQRSDAVHRRPVCRALPARSAGCHPAALGRAGRSGPAPGRLLDRGHPRPDHPAWRPLAGGRPTRPPAGGTFAPARRARSASSAEWRPVRHGRRGTPRSRPDPIGSA